MVDPTDPRELYLTRVAAGLQLPPSVAHEIVEELAGHLADATETLQAEGLDAAMAEREAMARLGNPDVLSESIRLAHQTRRRALVAAGFGVLAGLNGAFWGYLFAGGMLSLTALVGFGLLSVLISVLGLSVSGWQTWNPIIGVLMALFAAGLAGNRVIGVVATRSYRQPGDIVAPVALVGAAAIGWVTIFWIRIDQDPATVALLFLTPVAFAAGVLLPASRRVGARSGRIRLTARGILGLVALLTIAWLVLGIVTLRSNQGRHEPGKDWYAVYPQSSLPEVPYATDFGIWSIGMPTLSLTFDPPSQLSAWRDLRAEAWPAATSVDGWGGVDPIATGPILSAPLVEREAGVVEAGLSLPATKTRVSYVALVSGIGPDGIRYLLAGPDGPGLSPPWVGTAWEWFTTP